jgi:nitrogen fixation/metabolism regulation signal transduction histidine kinase
MLGRIEGRLALVILVTALLPLASAMMLAYSLLASASSVWLRPEVEQQLERGIDLYKDYIRTIKDDMRHQTEGIAGDGALRDAVRRGDRAGSAAALRDLFPAYAQLVSLDVEGDDGQPLASRDRGSALDEERERKLQVRRALGPFGHDGPPATLVATYAFDRRYEQELERAGEVHETYAQLEKERARVYASYFEAFAVLLGITVVATVVLGLFLARGITARVGRLAGAINEVAAGNLEVRVPVTGSDELTDLALVFNRMLGEMQESRARIEFLQRIGAWQEMARRLAHEIKNPLTPIQLAVQECHQKYSGNDPKFRALLDTTLEIVEEEVGTLRRLVGNFSSFARLPRAELLEASLRDFLQECADQLGHLASERIEAGEDSDEDAVAFHGVDVRWEIPDEPFPVSIDRQMLRRVVVNLVRNAVEAVRDPASREPAPADKPEARRGHVLVRAERRGDGISIVVEDDGPGVPEDARERVFDPYVTTKSEGTGLGLSIVKKIVVEHHGWITAGKSERLGGAAFVVGLPSASDAGSTPGESGGGAQGGRDERTADKPPPSGPRV